MESEKEQTRQGDHEMVKLFKNTKGYNWEIRLLEIDLDRLEKLNNDMNNRFGSENSNER